jgi:hypothetical protein
MNYLIVPRRRLGVAVSLKELGSIQPIKGDIQIAELTNEALGRVTISAWIFISSPHMPDPLPRLLDVRITGMSANGMNLTGVEQIGDAFYSQSWWCRGV